MRATILVFGLWACGAEKLDSVDTAGVATTPPATTSPTGPTMPTTTTSTTTASTTSTPGFVYPFVCDAESYPPIPVDAQSTVTPLTELPNVPNCAEGYDFWHPHRYGDFAPSDSVDSVCRDESFHSGWSHFMRPYAELREDAPYEVHVIAQRNQFEQECTRHSCTPAFPTVPVRVHPTVKPVVLVLSSFEGTNWSIEPMPGSRIAGVFTLGNYYRGGTQQVSGSPVPAVYLPGTTGDGLCGRDALVWEPHRTDPSQDRLTSLMQGVEDAFGVVPKSFQGCSQGEQFQVPAAECPEMGVAERVALDTERPNESMDFGECSAQANESAMCLARGENYLYVIGLDTGTACPYISEPWTGPPAPKSDSLVWTGEAAYRCEQSGVVRYDLVNRTYEPLNIFCNNIVEDAGRWYSLSRANRRLYAYDGLDEMAAADALSDYEVSVFWERLTVHEGIGYGAFVNEDALYRIDLSSGALLDELALEDFFGSVGSMDVMSDGTLVLVSQTSAMDKVLELFDIADGSYKRSLALPPSERIGEYGIVCMKP